MLYMLEKEDLEDFVIYLDEVFLELTHNNTLDKNLKDGFGDVANSSSMLVTS